MADRRLLPFWLTILLTVAALVYTFASGNSPLLGLDLQGGVSVVLQPTEPATSEQLDQSIEIMRRRVDGLGVAEPEITAQGSNIIVSLPGVDDPQRALDLVGQTARLRFRPVLEHTNPLSPEGYVPAIEDPITASEDVTDDAEVVLRGEPDDETGEAFTYRLGPMGADGTAVADARAELDQVGNWLIRLEMNEGETGIDAWNAMASVCFSRAATCPTGLIGIELDGTVLSAPEVITPSFTRDQISITGQFTDSEAKDLALSLRYGALPLELETQQTRTVSATLGRDALDAGIIAGLVGIALVALAMVLYYRLLGVIAMASFLVGAGLLWAIVAWLGESQGLALTLAGVTGLIVSVGVSVDSNIVYYENIKEDVRSGRTIRGSIESAFSEAFSTIVKADVSTLIGAGLIYWISIGAVRGFALFLGLATILDLFVAYFFMRPLCLAAGRSSWITSRPMLLGIPADIVDPSARGGGGRSRPEAATVGGGGR